jgi:hypothetical protein
MKNYRQFRLARLPNIVQMDVKVGTKHWYWKLLGINAKDIATSLEFKPGKNGSSNRYLKMQTLRILQLLGNKLPNAKDLDVEGRYGFIWIQSYNLLYNKQNKEEKKKIQTAWRVSYDLCMYSLSVFLYAIWKCDINCFNNKSKEQIAKIYISYLKIFRKSEDRIEIKRKWLQAPPGKARALGIPSYPWRIALCALQLFLEMFFWGSHLRYQHGYMQLKGTGTAWRELYNIIFKYKKGRALEKWWFKGYQYTKIPSLDWMYEFDLKNFFPSVEHAGIMELFTRMGFSLKWKCIFLIF